MFGKWFNWHRADRQINEQSQEQNIDMDRLPQHIAIIMDGNGRWAQNRGMPRTFGHRAGVDALRETVKNCSDLGVKVLTVYAFSTENWKRPTDEVSTLMNLIIEYLQREIEEMHKQGVQVRFIGDIESLAAPVKSEIERARARTAKNCGLILNIAVNYGGRGEILTASKRICEDVTQGKIALNKLDENLFAQYLYTGDVLEPDLVIRPGGDYRISNFLLWQIAYAEFWFCDVLWPDFSSKHLVEAISDFQRRNRRFGGVNNKT